MDRELSDIAQIDPVVEDPVDLFRMWHDEARKFDPEKPNVCCLATTSKELKVSARNVVLREFDNNGFVIVTDKRSRKADNLENVPNAAMCFLWDYFNDDRQHITRQVRVEGIMKKLEIHQYQHLYDREPLFCKIRSHVCHQGQPTDWDDLKRRHDEILEDFRKSRNKLPMPDHFVGYKLLPTMMEFYFARDHLIGDRVLYRREELAAPWNHHRIAA